MLYTGIEVYMCYILEYKTLNHFVTLTLTLLGSDFVGTISLIMAGDNIDGGAFPSITIFNPISRGLLLKIKSIDISADIKSRDILIRHNKSCTYLKFDSRSDF